jgi:hypothetical protein
MRGQNRAISKHAYRLLALLWIPHDDGLFSLKKPIKRRVIPMLTLSYRVCSALNKVGRFCGSLGTFASLHSLNTVDEMHVKVGRRLESLRSRAGREQKGKEEKRAV